MGPLDRPWASDWGSERIRGWEGPTPFRIQGYVLGEQDAGPTLLVSTYGPGAP